MRIGMFTNNYLPRISGVAHSVENFRKGLEELGEEVFIFAPKYESATKDTERILRFSSFRFSPNSYPLALPLSQKLKIIQSLNLDIIHSHHPYLLGRAAQDYAKKLNIPLVFSYHFRYEEFPEFSHIFVFNLVEKYLAKTTQEYIKNCDAVISPSRFLKKRLEKWNKNVEVIPSGIDVAKFKNAHPADIKKRYGLRKDSVLLLTVSRISLEKNLDFLVEALADTLLHQNKVFLMIVGRGNYKIVLKRFVKSLGIEDKVILTDAVDYELLPSFYKAADIFVFPSKFETQGLVFLEAMASGLPIVALKTPFSEELTNRGEGGILIAENSRDFRLAVERLLKDGRLRENLVSASSRIIERYAMKNTALRLKKVYQSLVSK